MTAESRDGGLGRFGRNCNQQSAGSLRNEEEAAVFLPKAFAETEAIANEIAVILQCAGEKSVARGFNRARKITDSRMINLEGHWLDIPLRIAKRHLSGVAQQSESRNVRHCVNGSCSSCLFLRFLQRFRRRAIPNSHRSDGRLQRGGRRP